MKINVFVPCRLKSTRLPGKGLMDIFGMKAIERTLVNAFEIPGVSNVFLLTSEDSSDDALMDCNLNGKVHVLRGSEDDVLERILPHIQAAPDELYIRITGDCPLVSTELAELLIKAHLLNMPDVTFTPSQIALGTGCEVYCGNSLLKLRNFFPRTTYSEYLIYYFTNNRQLFNVQELESPTKFIKPWRLTFDEKSDLELLNSIYSYFNANNRTLSFDEIEQYFKLFPNAHLLNINNTVKYKDDLNLVHFLKDVTTYK